MEVLSGLRELTILDNPINTSGNLKSFIVYRLGNVVKFNGNKISKADKKKSKAAFQSFDKVLQIPEKFQQFDSKSIEYVIKESGESVGNNKQNIKAFNKHLSESCQAWTKGGLQAAKERSAFEAEFERAFLEMLQESVQNHEGLI